MTFIDLHRLNNEVLKLGYESYYNNRQVIVFHPSGIKYLNHWDDLKNFS